MSATDLNVKSQILLRMYEITLEDPAPTIGSQQFYDLGDKQGINDLLLRMRDEGLITIYSVIELGRIPRPETLAGIRLTDRGLTLGKRIKESAGPGNG